MRGATKNRIPSAGQVLGRAWAANHSVLDIRGTTVDTRKEWQRPQVDLAPRDEWGHVLREG
jgi:hypothetical protein